MMLTNNFDSNNLPWGVRLCLCECLRTYISLPNPETLSEKCVEACENVFMSLLTDESFQVRHKMSNQIVVLFTLFDGHKAIYDDVFSRLDVSGLSKTCCFLFAHSHVFKVATDC